MSNVIEMPEAKALLSQESAAVLKSLDPTTARLVADELRQLPIYARVAGKSTDVIPLPTTNYFSLVLPSGHRVVFRFLNDDEKKEAGEDEASEVVVVADVIPPTSSTSGFFAALRSKLAEAQEL